jgi:putative transposase
MKHLRPSHREAVALFRHGVIGDLLARELARGDLEKELRRRAKQRYRPPGFERTRTYHWKTLQRWYYAAKDDPTGGLLPKSRARGRALELDSEQRSLLLDMRMEHPSAAAELILSEAVRNGVVEQGQVSLSTLRRLFEEAGLRRVSVNRLVRADIQRRRWQAASPGSLWHGDVCHLLLVDGTGRQVRVMVHGFLDDASRYVPALVARAQEREVDMLEVLCGALLRHPAPKTLYLDNGACYRGEVLALVCQRLGIRLVHATPYSPEARGAQERFWRTMRQRCTDHYSGTPTLHEVNQALWAWVDVDYHRRPHAGLLGETPRGCYFDALKKHRAPFKPLELARALEVEKTRRVRKDATFSLDGGLYEVSGRHLGGKTITLVVDGLTGRLLRASWRGRPVSVGPCDPVANRSRKRPSVTEAETPPANSVPFDPIANLLQKAREECHE